SQTETDYPEMRAMHDAPSIDKPEEFVPGFDRRQPRNLRMDVPSDSIEQVILRRGSSRKFDRQSITLSQLKTILDSSTCGIPADFPPLNDVYLIVNAVDDLNPGAYFYQWETGNLECLKEGNFRSEARHLGLQQDLPG